ncbi:MAG TPA: polysaccharide deacetylase family protein [Balneolales bacterium]|nr:polysaccharide deacetylase family protein [Balneolales bacterium]
MNSLTVIMYHYVRDLKHSKYPNIKGLDISHFYSQISYLKHHYQFVTISECIEAAYSESFKLPENSVLLTFDDGYIDHYENVYPHLRKQGIQGVFFPPVKAIKYHQVLDVNKIHFILANITEPTQVISDLKNLINEYSQEYHLESFDYYYTKLAHPNRFDTKDVVFIKHLLQKELETNIRHYLVDILFKKYVTINESDFAGELYMTQTQLQEMRDNNMYIGGHGYDHNWLNVLSPHEQNIEIGHTIHFLTELGCDYTNWVMCYPYGAYNDSLLNILRQKDCKLAFTVQPGVTSLNKDVALTLNRWDTNDFIQ